MNASRPSGRSCSVFHLHATQGGFTGDELLTDRLLRYVVVEDSCWKFADNAWRRRRPPWLRLAARRDWRLEGAALAHERARIIQLAQHCGVHQQPSGGGPLRDARVGYPLRGDAFGSRLAVWPAGLGFVVTWL